MTYAPDLWSRRRARVAEEAAAEAQAREAAVVEARQAALEDRPDHEILADLGLPDPDTMTAGDDFRAFMVRTVPERLRRRALRKLWTSNPVLACVDGLNDYDDDYTRPAVCGADMKTAYEVGRGFARRVAEAAPDRPADVTVEGPLEGPAPCGATQEPPNVADASGDDAGGEPATDPDRFHHVARDVTHDPAQPAAATRRMRFAFTQSDGGKAS